MTEEEKNWALTALAVMQGQLSVLTRMVEECWWPQDAARVRRVASRVKSLVPLVEEITTEEHPPGYGEPLQRRMETMASRMGAPGGH